MDFNKEANLYLFVIENNFKIIHTYNDKFSCSRLPKGIPAFYFIQPRFCKQTSSQVRPVLFMRKGGGNKQMVFGPQRNSLSL